MTLRIQLEPGLDNEVVLRFEVADTGKGIAEQHQEHILEPFRQADSSTTRHYGGSGLGLAICRQLVELMQGRIWVESEFALARASSSSVAWALAEELRGPGRRPSWLPRLRRGLCACCSWTTIPLISN